jgi:hypothetical protein
VSLARRLLPATGGGGSFAVTWTGLRPWASVSSTKAAGNPTFNFDAIPETVWYDGASTYWCVYMSWVESPQRIRLASATDPAGPWTAWGIIHEFSDVTWAPGTADGIYAPEIIEVGGTFYLFYSIVNTATGADGHIGYATSSSINGTYTDHGSAILSPGGAGAWDSLRVCEPSVYVKDGTWYMAYMGDKATFGLNEQCGIATATSAAGPWTKVAGNPLIGYGAPGAWDDELTADPFIWFEQGYWWCWYSGGGNGDGSGTRPWSMGLAYASDPTGAWTKHPDNPIVSNGGAGTWEEKAAWRGSVFVDAAGVYRCVYGGLNSTLATAKGGQAVLNITY